MPAPSPTAPRISADLACLGRLAGLGRGHQPGRHLPRPRARPASAGLARVGRRRDRERGPDVQERADEAAVELFPGLPARGEQGDRGRRPAAGQPVGDASRRGLPGQVAQPVGQRGGQIPAVGGLLRRVGRGDHGDIVRKRQVADGPLEDHAQQRGLDSGRSGGQLVEEQHAGTRLGQPGRPQRRGEPDRVPGDDGQPGEVGRFPDRRDDRLAGQAQGVRHRADGRRLARAGRTPQQDWHPGRDGDPERFRGGVPVHVSSVRPRGLSLAPFALGGTTPLQPPAKFSL